MSTIYKDFARGLRALDHTLPGPDMVKTPGGRAYVVGGKPYFDDVHFEFVGEDWFSHEALRAQLARSPELQGRVYAGAAGENNLSLIAASKAPAAILFDINPFQTQFWNEFLTVLAACPEPEDFARAMQDFAPSFYRTLNRQFNLEAMKKEYPGLEMQPPGHVRSVEEQLAQAKKSCEAFGWEWNEEEEKKLITGPLYENGDSDNSPFRHMKYSRFPNYFAMRVGWECGYTWLGKADLDWIKNRDFYRHLHRMAKNGAIGALTLDITDEASCRQLREYLDKVEFQPLSYGSDSGRTIRAGAPQKGADIGTLYLSNICHYLEWTPQEVKDHKAKGHDPCDYTQRPLAPKAFAKITEHLRSLVAPDAAIIRFDKATGAEYHPKFYPLFDPYAKTPHIPTPLEKGGLVPSIGG
jgi:hypothetical protein